MTQGALPRQILFFSIPLILSNLLQVLFNLADIAVVGQFVGSNALGAVGSTTILITMFTGFLIGLSGGINTLVARYFGAADSRGVHETVHTAALISLASGAILLTLGVSLSRAILQLLGTKPELLESANLYLRIYFLGMPALALYNFGNAVFSAIGNTRKPLFYLTISGILNVILNLFFVIVCGLEVAGVALASIISQYLSAFLIILALLRSKETYGMQLSALRLNGSRAAEILRIGLPAGLQNIIFALANLFIQSGVNTFSTTMVSGNSAAANADNIIYDVMMAFYVACSSFMGQNYGARQYDRVRKSYLLCLVYSIGIGMILGLLTLAFGQTFLGFFTPDAEVVEAGMKRLSIMCLSYGLSGFMDNTIAASRALGKTLVPTIVVVLGSCVFRIIWVNTIFAYFRTIPSLYLLYPASWILTGAAEIIYFIRIYRQAVPKTV